MTVDKTVFDEWFTYQAHPDGTVTIWHKGGWPLDGEGSTLDDAIDDMKELSRIVLPKYREQDRVSMTDDECRMIDFMEILVNGIHTVTRI